MADLRCKLNGYLGIVFGNIETNDTIKSDGNILIKKVVDSEVIGTTAI